ncbi:MAG: LON peptidase substrate-binding domain-containing protein [Acidimicrobiia bacterium]|nr:LON peptidase substrate-binding domain-containing protein [Acidimicrobiia bacterium]
MNPSPMFPLGMVLFPGQILPLHVFEPRYRQLVQDCLAGDREFGVVLIERGSEVGGDDVRTDIGTMARILEAEELPDGRWVVASVGIGRIDVEQWLPDDPYPRAVATSWPDRPPDRDLDEPYTESVSLLRRALALRSELGESTVPSTVELADDPELGSFHVAALAPLGPLDQQRLLAAPGADRRLELAVELLTEEIDVLTQRLALG